MVMKQRALACIEAEPLGSSERLPRAAGGQ
jgi:hypothetical protein